MSFRSVTAKNLVLRMIGLIIFAAAALITTGVTKVIRAQATEIAPGGVSGSRLKADQGIRTEHRVRGCRVADGELGSVAPGGVGGGEGLRHEAQSTALAVAHRQAGVHRELTEEAPPVLHGAT